MSPWCVCVSVCRGSVSTVLRYVQETLSTTTTVESSSNLSKNSNSIDFIVFVFGNSPREKTCASEWPALTHWILSEIRKAMNDNKNHNRSRFAQSSMIVEASHHMNYGISRIVYCTVQHLHFYTCARPQFLMFLHSQSLWIITTPSLISWFPHFRFFFYLSLQNQHEI